MAELKKGQAFAFVLFLLSDSSMKKTLNKALAANPSPSNDDFWTNTFRPMLMGDPFRLDRTLVDDRRDRWQLLWHTPDGFFFGDSRKEEKTERVKAGMKPAIDTSWFVLDYVFANAFTYSPGSCPNPGEMKLIWDKLNA